jgi:exopolyphosphatase / guanosine-5'-triphosphate,3'-diphosphate pyrophosphatase
MPDQTQYLAAIDLGSNSFHMIIGEIVDGQIKIIDRLREMVRLADGLDHKNRLSDKAKQRAILCLQRFGQRLREFPPDAVQAVGTNTLRKLHDSADFINDAEAALGHQIVIIAGVEEARLVFLGVANSLEKQDDKSLIVDIGGGSTELIIGSHDTPDYLESLYMGCVTFSKRFFTDGVINEENMRRAELYAEIELEPVKTLIKARGWRHVIGTSGTIRAIQSIINVVDETQRSISPNCLSSIKQRLLEAGHIDNINSIENLKNLKPERAPSFPGGVAILITVFKSLGIESMEVASGALREGLLHDFLDRADHRDIRQKTVKTFIKKFNADQTQSDRIIQTIEHILSFTAIKWKITSNEATRLIKFAVQLHEIGLSIAHSQYHRHGAYLAQHADMAGFSQQAQHFISILIRSHRRKIPPLLFKQLPKRYRRDAIYGCVLIRLAKLLHRNRSDNHLPEIVYKPAKKALTLHFPEGWLKQHPLTLTDLETEQKLLDAIKFDLNFD